VRTYLVKRLLLAIPTIIGAVTLVFFAIHLLFFLQGKSLGSRRI
jgi:ABC-type microcin C transport system permease subunit YejB